ncbi:MAG: CRTAC1 family protein, partial [Myxococcota bacterium]
LDGWADLYVAQEDDRPALVYRNLAGSRFDGRSLPVAPPLDPGAAHDVPAVFGDLDRDGRTDVVWARTDGSPIGALRNATDTGGRHWLDVAVADTPGTGERGGIGARVIVSAGGVVQFRDVTGGASRASQNPLSVRFGLDRWDGADYVFVVWSDGRTASYVGVEGDRTLFVP